MTIRLQPPVKYMWQDSYKVEVTSIATFDRHLTQPFGVNWAQWPYMELTGDIGHPGIDIGLPVGEKVFAAHDGIVRSVDNSDDWDGLGIILFDPVQKIQTWYWHNTLHYKTVGEHVKAGELIGLSGATGKAYGAHLHFGLYQTNDNGAIINTDNGFHGAINPIPHFYMPVANPENMTEDFISDMYKFYFGRSPNAEEAAYWLGKNYRDLLKAMLRDKLGLFQ